jgi:hypothetical protein
MSVTGEISGSAAKVDPGLWVRVDGAFLNIRREAPVGPTGHFSVGGLEMGTYLVEVLQGSQLRYVKTVDLDPNKPNAQLTISLPPY